MAENHLMYSMVDEDNLPSQIQYVWTNWVSQVSIFGFNGRKYDLNITLAKLYPA